MDTAATQAKQQFRAKPFLTILDGSPSPGKPRRAERSSISKKNRISISSSAIKKSGTKLQAYAGEGVNTVVGSCKKGARAVGLSLLRLPVGLFTAKPKKAKALERGVDFGFSGQGKVSSAERGAPPAELSAALPNAAAESPIPAPAAISFTPKASLLKGDSLANGLRRFSNKAAALRTRAVRAPKIILFFLIAAGALSAGGAALISSANFPVSPGSLLLPDEESAQAALMAYLEPDGADSAEVPAGSLPPIPVSVTIRSYTIRSGDTVEKIARRFGLRQDTIIAANNLQSASAIRPGVALRIPNMDGISHRVRSGESLSSLSRRYSIDVTRIVDANDLTSGTINIGQSLFIPNARLSSASLQNFYGLQFIWPLRGSISSPFGYRSNPFTGLRTYHSAIDIVAPPGTRVKATSGGSVADAGYNSVFGNYIILKHASGYQSLYAHLSQISVREGASVSQGSVIGYSGNTGQSTGPHLHFSIFKNGQALDPRKYVK